MVNTSFLSLLTVSSAMLQCPIFYHYLIIRNLLLLRLGLVLVLKSYGHLDLFGPHTHITIMKLIL
jgi:hypothetical protein